MKHIHEGNEYNTMKFQLILHFGDPPQIANIIGKPSRDQCNIKTSQLQIFLRLPSDKAIQCHGRR